MSGATVGTLLAVLCALMEAFGQIFLKMSVMSTVRQYIWLALGIITFLFESLAYTWTLHYLDVSAAYTIGSLSFVAVTLLSQWLLREAVTTTRWIGVALIVIGTSLVVARV